MRRRKITQEQIRRREQILSGIATQEPIPKAARKMLSVDGFRELFLQIKDLYPNNIEAYEALEEQRTSASSASGSIQSTIRFGNL